MRSSVEISDATGYTAAAHLLNLNDVPEDEQASRGTEIARQLASVIERRVGVDWSELPSRPDAKVEGGSGNDPQAGQGARIMKAIRLTLDRSADTEVMREHFEAIVKKDEGVIERSAGVPCDGAL